MIAAEGSRVEFDALRAMSVKSSARLVDSRAGGPILEGHSTRRAWYYGQRRALPPLVFCIVVGVVLVVTARTLAGAAYGIVVTVWIGVSAWRLGREPVLPIAKAQRMQQRRERI